MFHPESVHLASELVAEFGEQLLVQELRLQRFQHARFDFIAPDGLVVVAPSLIARPKASEAALAGHDEACAADTALREAREQILRPPRADRIASGSNRVSAEFLALLCRAHASSDTMRNCGTSLRIHSASGLRRDTRFPVSGFFT